MLLSRARPLLALLLAGFAGGAGMASAQIARPQKAKLELQHAAKTVAPGESVAIEALVAIDSGWHVQAHVPSYDYLIPTVLDVTLPAGFAPAQVDYPAPEKYKFSFAEEELDVYEGTVRLDVSFRVPAGQALGALPVEATLRYQACDDKSCLPPVATSARLDLEVAGAPATPAAGTAAVPEAPAAVETAPPAAAPGASAPAATSSPAAGTPRPERSLVSVLLLALVGGLILNGMPCVLPILSLKLFGLVKSAGSDRRSVRAGALATTAGILVSFWALAGAAIAARRAGAAIGWGIQFQQPGFVAFLAVVILLFSLNLWGLFEIPLPARLARLAESGPSEGLAGNFASGLFATLMATPCSAPFLGTALSFALGQSAGVILATLTAVGLGLALPYVALAASPGAVRFLPRPGAWMDTLRGAMGFLLAGALVWLLYVLSAQIESLQVSLFELNLLAVALAVWAAARTAAGGRARALAWLAVLVLSAHSILLAAEARPGGGSTIARGDDPIAWRPFDRVEAERLAQSGRLVFLDVTADWCVTCKVNERVVLHSPEVLAALADRDVIAMKADWTNRSDEIAAFLAEHGRYGIPFYMLYRPGKPPHVFGELIRAQEIVEVIRGG